MAEKTVGEYIDEAIERLKEVSADYETDEETQDKANAAITQLRNQRQNAALDAISNRTPNLQSLLGELNGVIEGHEHRSAAGAMSTLVGFTNEIRQVVDIVRGEGDDE